MPQADRCGRKLADLSSQIFHFRYFEQRGGLVPSRTLSALALTLSGSTDCFFPAHRMEYSGGTASHLLPRDVASAGDI